jgi:hypothetical protein
MQMVELPGIGKVLGGILWVLRSPFLLIKGALGKAVGRPEVLGRPEEPVLREAFTGWIDLLRKEAARNSAQHPLWAYISRSFHSHTLTAAADERFQQGLRAFQIGLADEVDQMARNIYEHLEKNPVLLNTFRTAKFGIEAGVIAAAVASAGILTLWSVPMAMVAASAMQFLVELCGKGYVDSQRELTRRRQQLLLTQTLSGPMAEWLIRWPATGGSEFERLQQVLQRIPTGIQQLDVMVRTALRS